MVKRLLSPGWQPQIRPPAASRVCSRKVSLLGKRTMKHDQRIKLLNDEDVRSWCESFGCTPAELQAAVRAVGPMALDVQAYLKKLPR